MITRPYQPSDLPKIMEIQTASQQDLQANTPQDYFDDLENIDTAFKNGVFLVTICDGEVAGFGGLTSSGEIVRMRVSSHHRRRGIATKMLHNLLARAGELGITDIHLHTLEEQRNAQKLYESVGFKEAERGQLYGNAVIRYIYEGNLPPAND